MNTTFHVGDRVRVPLGRRKVVGVISEARGSIGARGEHLFRILVFSDPFEPTAFEFSEGERESLGDSPEVDPPMETAQVIDYLKNGGLISILRSNLSGGRDQPRAWLRPDNIGNVTHTFIKDRGRIGGESVPFAAVDGNRIFMPKQDEVTILLRGFGLDPAQAAEVIRSVGTSPA